MAALVIPILAAVVAATIASRLLPGADGGLGTALWWLAVMTASTVALVLVDSQARRLLPLATLLKLTLVFPDRAPSRLRVALRAGTVRNLEERLARGRHEGLGDDLGQAAFEVLTLTAALSRHDRRTRGHSERVRGFTDLIAHEMHLPVYDADRLRWAALLHDIGKMRVDPGVLNKHGSLNSEEWDSIHRHPVDGARMTARLRPWLGGWADAIEQHHERWDGQGYPHGLSGSDISLSARVVAVADAFEVMTSTRSYRRPLGAAAGRDELAGCAGTHFDPVVVRAFLNVSIGRIRWVMAPLAWLADLPFVRSVSNAGGTAAETAGTAMAFKTAAALSIAVVGGVGMAPLAPAPPAETLAAGQHREQPLEPPAPSSDPPSSTGTAGTSTASPGGAAGSAPASGASGASGAVLRTGRSGGGGTGAGQGQAPGGGARAEANQPPTARPDRAATSERSVRVDVLANDSDSDGLDVRSLRVVSQPAHGRAKAFKGVVRYKADHGFMGMDTFHYRVCDTRGECSEAVVQVFVLAEDDDGDGDD